MSSEKKVVLAIDDNPQQLEHFNLLLAEKYDLRVAESASAALAFLVKNKADVILLDIEMPDISGFEFLGDIRNLLHDVKAPIIIVSGNNDDDFLAQAKQSDAFDVLTKPVKQDDLINVIEKALAVEVGGKQ